MCNEITDNSQSVDWSEIKLEKKGGLVKKIADIEKPCMSPQHNPPSHMYLEAGVYEYICPSCGETTQFTVPLRTY